MNRMAAEKRKPFQPVSKDWNFYRDLALLWPLIIGSFLAGAELFNKSEHGIFKVELLAVVLGLLLLTHEKRLMLGAVAGCFALYSIYVLIRYRYLPAAAIFVVAGTVWLLTARFSRHYRPSYEWPDEIGGFEAFVFLVSLLVTFAGLYLLNR